MMKVAKALHLIGLAMFLGSILGHITVGSIPVNVVLALVTVFLAVLKPRLGKTG